jgi:hypothetical protein
MSRNPTSVLWSVITVHITAVDLIARRFLSFIGEKVLERFPAGADANASAPVMLIAPMLRIGASSPDVNPGSIGRGWLSMTMLQRVRKFSQTAAAFRMTAAEMLRDHDHLLAAATAAITKPARVSILRIRTRNALNDN